jgi:hypothetical protein
MRTNPVTFEREPPPRLRRSYSAVVFGGPWLLALVGLGLMAFGLFADRPTAVQASTLTIGAVMVIIGFLALRISGPLELTPKGVKGNIDAIPSAALFVARSAAEKVTPGSKDHPARGTLADGAAFQALEQFSLIQAAAGILELDEFTRRLLEFLAANGSEQFIEKLAQLLDGSLKIKNTEHYGTLMALLEQTATLQEKGAEELLNYSEALLQTRGAPPPPIPELIDAQENPEAGGLPGRNSLNKDEHDEDNL